jgi:hypothetical protein
MAFRYGRRSSIDVPSKFRRDSAAVKFCEVVVHQNIVL